MADRYWVPGGTGNYNSTTNWSATSGGASGASVPGTADNVFFNASSGTGTATINVASTCANLNLTGFTGTLAYTFSLTIYGTIVNFGTGGYTVTGTSSLLLGSTNPTITSNGTTYTGNINFNGNTTYTLADNLSCTGTITFSNGVATTVNGNTLFIGGNLNHTGASFVTGTTAFVYNGTGVWSDTSSGPIRNNFTINTAGSLAIGANVYYALGTLTYIAGNVTTTGSTLNIVGNTTLNTNGITWNNITSTGAVAMTLTSNLTLTGVLTITGGTTSFVLGGNNLISTNASLTLGSSGTFTMPANQSFKTLSTTGTGGTINGNTLTVTENITLASGAPVTGTTAIIYGGTGTWTAGSATSVINNPLTINTAGTLTISGIVYKSGTFTYTAGTIIDTAGTVAVQQTTLNISGFTFRKLLVNNTITLGANINATTFGTFGANNTTFILAGNSINFTHLELGNLGTTTLPTNWVCQNIEFTNNGSGVLNTNSITINGNILQSSAGFYAGTTTFTYAGTGSWTQTSTGYFLNSFTINTAGTLTFISANIGGGIFTYTAGTVVTTGSTLYIRTIGTIMNHGSIVWNNVYTLTNVTSLILNNQLVCLNALTIENSQVTFSGTDGTFDVYYLNLNSSGTAARNPKLVSLKTYRVRVGFTSQGTLAFPITLSSTVASSKAIFTLDPGTTIDLGFVNATDIDSSLGRPIYSYKGVFTNTDNWGLLPTDNTRSSRSTFVG